MNYAYCRKETGKIENLQLLKIQQWAKDNRIIIDELIWDDEAKQKDSYDKRKLGLYLIPKLQERDIIIVSDVSCIGRSAIELHRLFEKVFAPKRVRIVCLSIDLDINFLKISNSEQLTLDKISFAAKLQKRIVHETTKASLLAKKSHGVKLGAANEKYKENRSRKSTEQLKEENVKKGATRYHNYINNPNQQSFLEILQIVFPKDCNGEILEWNWDHIRLVTGTKEKVLELMREYKKNNPALFKKWELTDEDFPRLRAYLQSLVNCINKESKRKKSKSLCSISNHNKTSTKSTKHNISLNQSLLNQIENETKASQKILSDIFSEEDDPHNSNNLSIQMKEMIKTLMSKESWPREEIESMCKKRHLLVGSFLEQINDYSYSIIDDAIIEDDGDIIYVTTDYKDKLT